MWMTFASYYRYYEMASSFRMSKSYHVLKDHQACFPTPRKDDLGVRRGCEAPHIQTILSKLTLAGQPPPPSPQPPLSTLNPQP